MPRVRLLIVVAGTLTGCVSDPSELWGKHHRVRFDSSFDFDATAVQGVWAPPVALAVGTSGTIEGVAWVDTSDQQHDYGPNDGCSSSDPAVVLATSAPPNGCSVTALSDGEVDLTFSGGDADDVLHVSTRSATGILVRDPVNLLVEHAAPGSVALLAGALPPDPGPDLRVLVEPASTQVSVWPVLVDADGKDLAFNAGEMSLSRSTGVWLEDNELWVAGVDVGNTEGGLTWDLAVGGIPQVAHLTAVGTTPSAIATVSPFVLGLVADGGDVPPPDYFVGVAAFDVDGARVLYPVVDWDVPEGLSEWSLLADAAPGRPDLLGLQCAGASGDVTVTGTVEGGPPVTVTFPVDCPPVTPDSGADSEADSGDADAPSDGSGGCCGGGGLAVLLALSAGGLRRRGSGG